MSTECPRCGLEHDLVGVVRWLWLFRDTKPKPPGKAVGILAMLAARMDAKTGCGWTTDPDLAELAEVADDGTVRAATRWGRDRLLLHRASKGYRITNERTEKSHWILTDPHKPTGDRLPHGKASQPGTGSPVAAEPTRDLSRANPGSDPDPTRAPSRSKEKPGKSNQGSSSSSACTTRTGTRGRAAATDDDDDSSAISDPREMLARIGVPADQTGPALALLAGLTNDVPGYLRAKASSPGEFVRWITRRLADGNSE